MVTYREEGRGERRARGTRTLSRRSHFVFSDRRQPAGHARFDAPRFIHSAWPRGFQPQQTPHHCLPAIRGMTAHCGPVHFLLAPLNQKKKKNRQIGPQSPSATRGQVAHKRNDGSIVDSPLGMTEQGLRKRKGSWSRVGKWEECRTRIRVGGEGGDEQFIYYSHSLPHSHHSAQNFYTAGPCPVSSAPPKRRTTHSANRSPDSIGPSPSHFPFRSFIPPPLFFFLPRPASLPSDPPYRPDDLDQGGALQALRHPGSLHSPTLTQLPLTPPPIHVNQPVHLPRAHLHIHRVSCCSH